MVKHFVARTVKNTVLALVAWTVACAGGSPTTPSAGTHTATPAAPPTVAAAPPTIAVISPNLGSAGGDTRTQVVGTRFQAGATVTFGGTTTQGRFDSRWKDGTRMFVDTPMHAVGTVDVVVTNPDGQSGLLAAAYTYAAPDSFDFNGSWSGYGNAGQDIPIGFTIRDNVVTSVTCDTFATLTFSQPVPVSNGAFAFLGDGGVAVSGRIVAASAAVGTINLAPCSATIWTAERQ
jgi:hypothetical protein